MKHLTISLVILSVLFLFSLCSSAYITDVVDETTLLLENAFQDEDRSQTTSLVREASSYWKEHQSGFCMLLRHDEVEEVISELALLEAYSLQEDWDDFKGNCASLLARLEHIKEMDRLCLHNIL